VDSGRIVFRKCGAEETAAQLPQHILGLFGPRSVAEDPDLDHDAAILAAGNGKLVKQCDIPDHPNNCPST
jgi:hypothetical protein